ncbi:MAG: hypothetical protein NVSMB68_06750 [Thermoanaerobaculia bacterium]
MPGEFGFDATAYNHRVRRLLVTAIVLASCSRSPEVPVNTLLWRVEGWTQAGNVRRAPAKFISFRASGEYVEHLCFVIEQPDTTVFLSRSDPHIVTIGRWMVRDREIVAARSIVARAKPPRGPNDPLCSEARYRVSGKSVMGQDGQYAPVTRLVSPDFEVYINDARQSGRPCPQPQPR